MYLQPLHLSAQQKSSLRREIIESGEGFSFEERPKTAALIAAIGVCQEVGTPNDEMARFLFDGNNGTLIPRENLRADLVRYKDFSGVKIWAKDVEHIEIRFPNLRDMFHPDDSQGLVVFPEIVAKYIESEGLSLRIVGPWALNTVFGGFSPAQDYYQTNMWELNNIDALRYAGLIERRALPFLGTHDLLAHIAGSRGEQWDTLVKHGRKLRDLLQEYFHGVTNPHIGAKILPYVAGIMLDDLAQPPAYGAQSRLRVLEEVMGYIDRDKIAPDGNWNLLRFPPAYEALVDLARFSSDEEVCAQAGPMVKQLVKEIEQYSVAI